MITRETFGHLAGKAIHTYKVTTDDGISAMFTDFGARLVQLNTKDRNGVFADIVLGFDDLASYVATDTYFGATVGRYGNRVTQGRFQLDGREISLDRNEGANHLHGGAQGFDRKVWTATYDQEGGSLQFQTSCEDGEMGFPGACVVRAGFELTERRLRVVMECETDATTVVNMVHHSYFNLAGHDSGNVLDQEMTFASDFYTPVDAELLATGEVLAVAGSPFDFREARTIGSRIGELPSVGGAVFTDGGGYDHNWCLREAVGEMRECALVRDPLSGRVMRLQTTEPGVQFYAGGYLAGETGKGGSAYGKYAGFTLETQKWPCSPNFAHFPSTRLEVGDLYRHEMIFDFGTSGS